MASQPSSLSSSRTSRAMSNYASKLIKCTFPSQGVLQVTLARPPVNAYNSELSAELQRHFERASGDPDVRCVVLRSDLDKGFTAGLDLLCVRSLTSSSSSSLTLFVRIRLSAMQRDEPVARGRRPCASSTSSASGVSQAGRTDAACSRSR